MARAMLLAIVMAVMSYSLAGGHACDDVYMMAKDNLVVKVSLPNNQLRINKEATFDVFLLNTMNMHIDSLNMELVCPLFTAKVKPAETWTSYPQLMCIAGGGKRESFSVTVKRKSGTADGKYKADLRLFISYKKSENLKTVDMAASADITLLPKAAAVTIDGKSTASEWEKATLCSDMYKYVPVNRYYGLVRCDDQPRYRISIDADYVYFSYSGQPPKNLQKDTTWLYVAATMDETPTFVTFSRLSGAVTGKGSTDGVELKLGEKKDFYEARIPRKVLGLDKPELKSFYVNIVRGIQPEPKDKDEIQEEKIPEEYQYWRGNGYSYQNPVVYAVFQMPELTPAK